MRTTNEVLREIEVKSTELNNKFAEAAACKSGEGNGIIEEIHRREEELVKLEGELKSVRDYEGIFERNNARLQESAKATNIPSYPSAAAQEAARQQGEFKSLGQRFGEIAVKSADAGSGRPYELIIPGVRPADFVDMSAMKTTMSTGAGFAPFVPRSPVIVDSAQRRPVVATLIPTDTEDVFAVKYMEETTFTNNAAATAEGSAAASESALAWTERTSTIEKITAYLPITDEQVANVKFIMQLLDRRLSLMWSLTEETQLLTGSGSTPELMGFLNKSGVQTQAKGNDAPCDAIYKSFTKIRHTGFAEPTGVIIHPNDWEPIRLLTTADGLYLFGSPAEAGPETVFGKMVVVTTAITENTTLTGDFQMYSHITRRDGATVEVGYINDDFAKGKKTVKITGHESLEIYRATAFCKTTGM